MQAMTWKRGGWAALALSMTVWGFGACGSTADVDPGESLLTVEQQAMLAWQTDPGMVTAQSCEEAEELYREMVRVQVLQQLEQQRKWAIEWFLNPYDYGMAMGSAEDGGTGGDVMGDASASPISAGDEGSGNAYTDTNNQVEGVDEADLVKTDGDTIYALIGGDLVIVDAWPAEDAQELGRVRVPGYPSALHRFGDTLVALSSANESDLSDSAGEDEGYDEYDYYYYAWNPVTVATIIDASDPTAPSIVASHVLEGWSLSTRRIGERIYFVQQNQVDYPGIIWWVDAWSASSVGEINHLYRQAADANLETIASMTIADFLPTRWTLDADGKLDPASEAVLTGCTDVRVPRGYSGWSLVSVATLDLGDGPDATPTATTIVGSWGSVYASKEALYVAVTNWDWWWFFEDDDDAQVSTRLHRFPFDSDTGEAKYEGSAQVPGYTLNQFSIDEHEGRVRIATTAPDWSVNSDGWWDFDSESYVTVLDTAGGELEQLGQVGGLGEGEQIYSVRFIGDTGYVVTFRQVDPLYVIDLRDPAKPAVTGELKIPGFSSYMHPIGDGMLLTIGRDADEDGFVGGLQFQVFDVSDPTDPKLASKTVLGDGWNTWSEALWDHHAFTWYPEKSLLAVPVSTWGESDHGYWGYDSELTLFHVDPHEGVTPAGAVDHEVMLRHYTGTETCWDWWTGNAYIRRGVFIEDYVFSISTIGIAVHDVDALAEGPVKELPLLDGESLDYGYCYYY